MIGTPRSHGLSCTHKIGTVQKWRRVASKSALSQGGIRGNRSPSLVPGRQFDRFLPQQLLDAETRFVQRIAGRNFRHRRHLPLGRAQLSSERCPNCRQVTSQRLRFPFLSNQGRCDSVIDLRVNSGTVQSNSCGSLKASGVDVRSSVHAEHEREQVSMPSSCEIRTVGRIDAWERDGAAALTTPRGISYTSCRFHRDRDRCGRLYRRCDGPLAQTPVLPHDLM